MQRRRETVAKRNNAADSTTQPDDNAHASDGGTSSTFTGKERTMSNITSRTIFLDHLICMLTDSADQGPGPWSSAVPAAMQEHVAKLLQRACTTAAAPPPDAFAQVR